MDPDSRAPADHRAPSANIPDALAKPHAATSSPTSEVVFELGDLRQHDGAPPAAPGTSSTPRRMPSRRFWRLAVVVFLPLLAVLVIAGDLYAPTIARIFAPKPVPPLNLRSLVVRPQQTGMNCLTDAAWSPDGARIALLGDGYGVCGNSTFSGSGPPARVLVYDGGSGRLVTQFAPDAADIGTAVQSIGLAHAPPSTVMPASVYASAIHFEQLLWSPDGARLALIFSVDVFAIPNSTWRVLLQDGEPLQPIGVLLQNADGTQPRVVIGLQSVYIPYQGEQSEWDLQTSSLVATPSQQGPFGVNMLPPALGYTWQPDGTLAPQAPLTSLTAPAPAPLGPVGNPVGAVTFTIWQPGFAAPVYTTNGQGQLNRLPGVFTWQTSFAAWSPDGRYLLVWSGTAGLLSLPNRAPVTSTDVNTYQIEQPVMLPLRDAGLLSVLPAINPIDPVGASIAWRPDGRVVAAFTPWNQSGSFPVRLYDCASGRLLATLATPVPASNPLAGRSDLARWTPDGKRLLVFDPQLGELVIWDTTHLPR